MPSPNTLRLVKDNTTPVNPRKKGKRYTNEFKEEVFQYWVSTGCGLTKTKKMFNLPHATVNCWRKKYDWVNKAKLLNVDTNISTRIAIPYKEDSRKDAKGHFTEEFKESVFQYWVSIGCSSLETSKAFNIGVKVIRTWKFKYNWEGRYNNIKGIKETFLPMDEYAQDAFNYYFALGSKRSFLLLSKKINRPLSTIRNMAQRYNWKGLIKQRDQHINACVQARQDMEIVQEKDIYRKEIKEALAITRQTIRTAIDSATNHCNLKVNSIKQFNEITTIMERLIKLDMMLAGEEMIDTQNNTQVNITIGNA